MRTTFLGLKTKKLWENPEYRKHMSKAHLGQVAWNKGKKTGLIPKTAFKKGQVSIRKGKKNSKIHNLKMSLARKGKPNLKMRGKNHPFWKGGISRTVDKIIRQSLEYKLWRRAVFQRDNYQCIWGGKEHGNKLQADHIKPFSKYPALRFAIDNGRTLCEDCHKKTDTYGGKPK